MRIEHLNLAPVIAQKTIPSDSIFDANQLSLITRKEWNAVEPTNKASLTIYHGNLKNVLKWIVIHHSAFSDAPGPKLLQTFHMMSSGFNDIGYHFIIGKDGKLYEGRSIDIMGAHTGSTKEADAMASAIRNGTLKIAIPISDAIDIIRKLSPNYGTIGIVLDGEYEYNGSTPPVAQIETLKKLILYLTKKYEIPQENIIGHSDVQNIMIESAGLTSTHQDNTVCPGKEVRNELKKILENLPANTAFSKRKIGSVYTMKEVEADIKFLSSTSSK